MKNLIYVAIIAMLVSCAPKLQCIYPEANGAYGPAKVDVSKAVSVDEMLTSFNKTKQQQEFTFRGKITEVCQAAGCWIQVDKGNNETFMVRFKDHFTIPTNTPSGSMAVLHGIAYMDTVTVEQLQHFAHDAGKSKEEISKITEPLYRLNFQADGILFKDETIN